MTCLVAQRLQNSLQKPNYHPELFVTMLFSWQFYGAFFFFFFNSSLVHTLFPSTGKVFSVYLFSLIGLVLTTLHREAVFFTHQFQVKPLFVQRWLPRQSFNWFVSFPHSHCRVGRKLSAPWDGYSTVALSDGECVELGDRNHMWFVIPLDITIILLCLHCDSITLLCHCAESKPRATSNTFK